MKLIVGLGNPGRKYAQTRHNIGFWVLAELSRRLNIPLNKEKFHGVVGEGMVGSEKVVLLMPTTYMNLSGESVRPAMDWYKADLDELLVVYDDMDLPLGKIRLRLKGSSGGHNGMKSIIQHLGTDEFKRLKLGVDRPPAGISVPNYVLAPFLPEEQSEAQSAAQMAAEAVEAWLSEDFLQVMNRFNVNK
ncbi:aminoacyl-tRNA hydrolase [Risungbinella massiliensis]|uniref:aminoacyl-tRNA hydrolase n=1 Tax=Risungbinella massiliensis TaxID=1329796 RepID=UPI0005CB8720|nr:aminoacyl-tRNA hydrolase [Risungbinella massiliensis]